MAPPTFRLPLTPALPFLHSYIVEHGEPDQRPGVPWALAEMTGLSRRRAQAWVSQDAVNREVAERLSDAVGLHPSQIWGPQWWHLSVA